MSKEYIQKVTNAFEEFLLENNYFSEFYDYVLSFYNKPFYEFCKWALSRDLYDPRFLIVYHPYSKLARLCLIDKWETYIKDHDL